MGNDGGDDLRGEKLGPYLILSLAGEGAMAKVYRAVHQRRNREVALKVIRRIPGQREDTDRFEREKKALEKLHHPHIMAIEDFSGNSSFMWIASPLIEGGTLADRLHGGPLSMEKVAEAAGQIAQALDFAHEMHIVHRDLKPSNVLVEQKEGRDHYYLADFGVAKLLEAEGLTLPGMTVGTPDFMSPEQVLGKKMDGRSDQYSLGILCYQLATGDLPFQGDYLALMQHHAKTPPPPPPHVSDAFSKVVMRALAKDPSQRFASCGEFAEQLDYAVYGARPESAEPLSEEREESGGPLSTPPPGLARRPRSLRRRKRWPLFLAICLAAAGLAWWAWKRSSSAPLSSPESPSPVSPSPTHHPKTKSHKTPFKETLHQLR